MTQLPVTQDDKLAQGQTREPLSGAGHSDHQPSGLQALQDQQQALLQRADKALETRGHHRLVQQALDVLQQAPDAQQNNRADLQIQVAVPPDFEPVTVFPPDPAIPADKLEKLQKTAIASLSGYKDRHITPESQQGLEREVTACKEGLAQIRHRCENSLQDDGLRDDQTHWWDWERLFEKLEARDASFELKSEREGVVTLTPGPRDGAPAQATAADPQDT